MMFDVEEGSRGSRRIGIGISYVAFGVFLAAALLLMKLVVSLQWLGALADRILVTLD